MSVPQKVYKLLRRDAVRPYCDDCIAKKIGAPRRQQAQQIASTLALTQEFKRRVDVCSSCGEVKNVTHATGR